MMNRGYANLNAFVERDKQDSRRISQVERHRKDSHISNERTHKHGLVPRDLRSQASTIDQHLLFRRGSRGGDHDEGKKGFQQGLNLPREWNDQTERSPNMAGTKGGSVLGSKTDHRGDHKANRKDDPKVHSKHHKSSHHRHHKDAHRHHRRDSHRHHRGDPRRHHHHHQKEMDAKETSSSGLLWSCVKSVCSSFASVVRKNIFTNEMNTSDSGRGKIISDQSRLIDKNAQRNKQRDARKGEEFLEQDNNLQNRNGDIMPRRTKKIKNASYEFSDNDLKNLFMLESEERGEGHSKEDAKRVNSGEGLDGRSERGELGPKIVQKDDAATVDVKGEVSIKGEASVGAPQSVPNIMVNNGSFNKLSQRDDLNSRGRRVTHSSEEEHTLGRLGGLKPAVETRQEIQGEKHDEQRRKGSLPFSGRSNRTSGSSSDGDGEALRNGLYAKDSILRQLLEAGEENSMEEEDDSDEVRKTNDRQPTQSNKTNAPEQGKTFLQNGVHQMGDKMSSLQSENVEKLYYQHIFENSQKKGKSKSMDDPDDSGTDSFKNIFYNRKKKKKKKKGKLGCMPEMEQITNGANGEAKESNSEVEVLNTVDAANSDASSPSKSETHKQAQYFRSYIKSSEEIKQIRFEFKQLIQTIDSFIVQNSTSEEIMGVKSLTQGNDHTSGTQNSHKRESKNEANSFEMDKGNEAEDEGSADEQSMRFIDAVTSEDKSGYVILKNDEESLIEALEKLRIEKRKKDAKVSESDEEANRIGKADVVALLDPGIFFKCVNKDHYEKAAQILRQKGENGVLIEKFNVPLLYSQIKCLMDTRWLNDEVINFYMSMLQEYNTKNIKKDRPNNYLPKIFTFSTFFFQSLSSNGTYNYNKVSRWTKRKQVDIFSFDLILIPLHVGGNHWTLGSINMKEKKIKLYDSLNMSNAKFFEYMRHYLVDEMRDKKQMELDVSAWEYNPDGRSEVGIPCQENGYDCGVFTCMFAKCLSFNRSFDFSQRDIKEIRMKMVSQEGQGVQMLVRVDDLPHCDQ
ncbi:Ulp1 protease family C-terminal catalytic domain containing protein [Plasmodium coatneyi]|uniref:Ulp1 protease family C-terminal catalytic domain containing protein n=1 Tax=Plasmodium coatneyi TaxID=208452 RepID=A0A1B1E871_9APIC|nr:Ulp1 protease family C-terminal catalytic domain containing protein [Plasmodium coatneyi]ANQ11195.1 Ulp1 protease family C-terminal catalytic domain containing protein [Plasmodium coatneyi]